LTGSLVRRRFIHQQRTREAGWYGAIIASAGAASGQIDSILSESVVDDGNAETTYDATGGGFITQDMVTVLPGMGLVYAAASGNDFGGNPTAGRAYVSATAARNTGANSVMPAARTQDETTSFPTSGNIDDGNGNW
jgi:hypothetical protein